MEQDQNYRKNLRKILSANGYEVIDPWVREKVIYSAAGREWCKSVPVEGFIRRDLDDIKRCHLFVAYLPRLSAGTIRSQNTQKENSCYLNFEEAKPLDRSPCRQAHYELKSIRESFGTRKSVNIKLGFSYHCD